MTNSGRTSVNFKFILRCAELLNKLRASRIEPSQGNAPLVISQVLEASRSRTQPIGCPIAADRGIKIEQIPTVSRGAEEKELSVLVSYYDRAARVFILLISLVASTLPLAIFGKFCILSS